jgi:hypothetical protein
MSRLECVGGRPIFPLPEKSGTRSAIRGHSASVKSRCVLGQVFPCASGTVSIFTSYRLPASKTPEHAITQEQFQRHALSRSREVPDLSAVGTPRDTWFFGNPFQVDCHMDLHRDSPPCHRNARASSSFSPRSSSHVRSIPASSHVRSIPGLFLVAYKRGVL